jgi:uncharacterized protein with FMN-binding domain
MTNESRPSHEYDPAMIARLERLAARRAANDTGARPVAQKSPGRRSHPSKRSRVAALGLSLAATGGGGGGLRGAAPAGLSYAFASTAGATAAAPTVPLTGTIVSTSAAATATTATTAKSAASTATTAKSAASTAKVPTMSAATTTVNGAVLTNKYGTVQVQAVFAADGGLGSVSVLQLPTDRKSVNINDRAVPTLNSAAISLQSARVHTVSGATYTSKDYVLSLQAAIDTARAAGITKLA